MQIRKNRNVNVSAEKAWEILVQFGNVDAWASTVQHSTADQLCQGATRVCQTAMGKFDEKVTSYNPQQLTLSYTAEGEKIPFFVKRLENTWQIRPVNVHECRVSMLMNVDIMFPFTIFPGPMMKMQMSKIAKQTLEEFKHFAETGRPHSRKLKLQMSKEAMAY
ncbi:MAG: SRPBCC family protein [Pseudomonadota bacterium]